MSEVCNGVRQGCIIAPVLFYLCTSVLSFRIGVDSVFKLVYLSFFGGVKTTEQIYGTEWNQGLNYRTMKWTHFLESKLATYNLLVAPPVDQTCVLIVGLVTISNDRLWV